jgi:protein-S-isoprenylcysteine O-methyltransferase Ste14
MFDRIFKNRFWPALGRCFSVCWIYLGLPVLAWGGSDLRGFLSNPVRASFCMVVIASAIFSGYLTYITPSHPEGEQRFDLGRWHAYMFETIFVLSSFGDRRGILAWNENPALRWTGLGIYLIGTGIFIWSNLTWVNHLRREAERAVDDPVLLFEGPFHWIRYPSLLYLAIYCLGFALMFRSWVGLFLMVPLIAGIINRIDNMEKIFAEKYKRVWPLRRHASKKLIPFLY